MNKLQDLFNKPDGNKLMDTKLVMQIVDIPSTPSTKQAKTGTEIVYFPVTMQHQGNQYSWELSSDQLKRLFTKTKKSGEVFWNAKAGETVNVWYATNQKTPSRPYYAVEPLKDGELYPVMQEKTPDISETLAKVDDVFGSEAAPVTATQQTVVTPKPTFSKKNPYSGKEDTKWDGTPRQGNFRAGIAGILQSILCNPNVNPFNEEHRAQARAVAIEEMLIVRERAIALEAECKD